MSKNYLKIQRIYLQILLQQGEVLWYGKHNRVIIRCWKTVRPDDRGRSVRTDGESESAVWH